MLTIPLLIQIQDKLKHAQSFSYEVRGVQLGDVLVRVNSGTLGSAEFVNDFSGPENPMIEEVIVDLR